MSRLPLRYIKAFVDRQTGAVYHYYRRKGHPLVRLPGLPWSAEFMAAYQIALAGPALPHDSVLVTTGSQSCPFVSRFFYCS